MMRAVVIAVALAICSAAVRELPHDLDYIDPRDDGTEPWGAPERWETYDDTTVEDRGVSTGVASGCSKILLDTNKDWTGDIRVNVSVKWFFEKDNCSLPLLMRQYKDCDPSLPPSPSTCSGYSGTIVYGDPIIDRAMVNASMACRPGVYDSGIYTWVVIVGKKITTGKVNLTVPNDDAGGCNLKYGFLYESENEHAPAADDVAPSDSPIEDIDDGWYTDIETGNKISFGDNSVKIKFLNSSSIECSRRTNREERDPWSDIPDNKVGASAYMDNEDDSSETRYQATYDEDAKEPCVGSVASTDIPETDGFYLMLANGSQSLLLGYFGNSIESMPKRVSVSMLIDSWLNEECVTVQTNYEDERDDVKIEQSETHAQAHAQVQHNQHDSSTKADNCHQSSASKDNIIAETGCSRTAVLTIGFAFSMFILGYICLGVYICVLKSKISYFKRTLRLRPIISHSGYSSMPPDYEKELLVK